VIYDMYVISDDENRLRKLWQHSMHISDRYD